MASCLGNGYVGLCSAMPGVGYALHEVKWVDTGVDRVITELTWTRRVSLRCAVNFFSD
jgi:hypothetical protein